MYKDSQSTSYDKLVESIAKAQDELGDSIETKKRDFFKAGKLCNRCDEDDLI